MPYSSSCRQLHVPVLLSKVPQTGCLKQQTLIFPKFWRVESPGSRSTGFSFWWAFLPHLQAAAFSLGLHVASLPCVHMDPEPASSSISLFIRTLTLLDQGPTLMISFNHKYFLTTKIVILFLGLPHMN